MKLGDLTDALLRVQVQNQQRDTEITHMTTDSREVVDGSLFIAIRGYTVDGHQFVSDSVAKGARAVVVEAPVPDIRVPQLIVPDSLLASGILANVFYRHPSRQLRVIGVTGTNGKSTVTHLIERILADAGKHPGLCGTLGARAGAKTIATANTTPFPVELQSILHVMADEGCTHCVMEVSSHALERRQTAGIDFDVAVFTNLTQDHLNFHGTMENYRAAKGKLFTRLGNGYEDKLSESKFGIVNADDEAGAWLAAQTVAECLTYGMDRPADVHATDVEIRAEGASFRVHTWRGETAVVHLQMTGRFNVYNALAAISVGLLEGIALTQIADSLASIPGVPGRLERVAGASPFTVLVDYSHTPDSLENALTTIQEFVKGRILCVVGCGGDRDSAKRPMMARIACEHSHVAILTSDNPRTEDPESILDDMEDGVRDACSNYIRILDRKTAINEAVRMAQPDDVVLIAGKGHETYQIVGRTKHHFDDREVAREAMEARLQ